MPIKPLPYVLYDIFGTWVGAEGQFENLMKDAKNLWHPEMGFQKTIQYFHLPGPSHYH